MMLESRVWPEKDMHKENKRPCRDKFKKYINRGFLFFVWVLGVRLAQITVRGNRKHDTRAHSRVARLLLCALRLICACWKAAQSLELISLVIHARENAKAIDLGAVSPRLRAMESENPPTPLWDHGVCEPAFDG